MLMDDITIRGHLVRKEIVNGELPLHGSALERW